MCECVAESSCKMTDKVLLDRRHLVQTLLASARTLKVEPVRDGAARSKVEL